MKYQLAIEAIMVGVVLSALVILVKKLFHLNFNNDMQLILIMFLVGISIHLGFELTGANKMYCDFGVACMA